MDTIISVLLALSTLVLGIVAIGGETIREKDELTLMERVTKRGWLAMVFLIAAFTFTVIKDNMTRQDQIKLKESTDTLTKKTSLLTDKQEIIKQQTIELANVQARIEEKTSTIEQLQRDIVEISRQTNIRISQNKRSINSTGVILRNETNSTSMRVYGGDEIHYTVLNNRPYQSSASNSHLRLPITSPTRLFLEVGSRTYPLEGQQGRRQIMGLLDELMTVNVIRRNGHSNISVKLSHYTSRDQSDYLR